jgi:hypothetical protein
VPFADLRGDFRHHLLAVAGNLDSVQVLPENTNEVVVRHASVLDLEALAAERQLHRVDARISEQQLS